MARSCPLSPWLALLTLRQPASLFPDPNCCPWLGAFPHRKPASVLPDPEMANSGSWLRLLPSSPAGILLPSPSAFQLLPAVVPSLGILPLSAAGRGQRLPAVAHWLGLLPARKPPSPFRHPQMAHSSPWSHPRRGCPLFASRHHCSLALRWPIPVHGRLLAGAAPCSQAGSPLASPRNGRFPPAVMHSLGLLPLRHPAYLFPLAHLANRYPRPCTLWSCSLLASRHPSCRSQRWLIPACGLALAAAAPCASVGEPSIKTLLPSAFVNKFYWSAILLDHSTPRAHGRSVSNPPHQRTTRWFNLEDLSSIFQDAKIRYSEPRKFNDY